MSPFGLDIGSDSIKIAQVEGSGGRFSLVTAGMIKTPGNGLASESEKDLVMIAETIKKLMKEVNLHASEVVIALPERDVFTQVVEMPKMSTDQLNQAIPWEAENLIPRPLTEVNLDWQILNSAGENSTKMKVLLIAAPKEKVNKYLKVLRIADLDPLALETNTLAITRLLNLALPQTDSLLVDFGAESLGTALIKQGQLLAVRSLPFGGQAITRAISTAFNFDFPMAEEYKKTYGFTSQLENKVASAMMPVLTSMASELKKIVHFYEEKEQKPLKLITLVGAGALLPGLPEFLTQALALEVQVIDPFSVIKTEEKTHEVFKKSAPLFAVAIGLAMKEV